MFKFLSLNFYDHRIINWEVKIHFYFHAKPLRTLRNTALLKLIENQPLAEQMGKAGRQYVIKQYEWQNSVDILEAVLIVNC
jgi:hypothetical protein